MTASVCRWRPQYTDRPHGGGHDAVPRDGPAPDAGRHRLPAPGVRGEPGERRHGDRVGEPVPTQPGPPDGRPALRALLRRRAAADGRHPRGHGSRRRPDEQPVGPRHVGPREHDVDEACDRRSPGAPPGVLDGRPDGGAATAGDRHGWARADVPGSAGEPPCGPACHQATGKATGPRIIVRCRKGT